MPLPTIESSSSKAMTKQKQKQQLLLPILIIPGFMSSGLEIKDSQLKTNWKGKRIWLNLSSIGISAMYFGTAQKKVNNNNNTKNCDNNKKDQDDVDDDDDEGEERKQEEHRQQQYSYKSSWLQHMMLDTKDLKSDPPGIRVRPIKGLDGVDYLTPGAMTSHISYVFGPVIKALEKKGYNNNNGGGDGDGDGGTAINLTAATYDWRLAPKDMELRDQYYTNTKHLIETMYHQNNDTPIILLCHSMGCKVAHYFLNFVADKFGQNWIDQYIHTYMPVGGPHLGAPKAARGMISGDKMSLETFLNDEEGLSLGRSWGSGPWLIPSDLPPGVPATAYILPHGVLEVTFPHAIDTNPLIHKRTIISRPTRYQLLVTVQGLDGNSTGTGREIQTPFHKISRDLGKNVVVFTDTMSFVTGSTQPYYPVTLQFALQEPGLASAKKEKERCRCNPFIWCVCCLCIPCMLAYKIIEWIVHALVRVTTITADAIAGSTGNSTTLAFSESIKIPQSVWKGNVVTIKVPLYHTDDYGHTTGCFGMMMKKRRRHARQVDLIVKLKWIQFNKEKSFRQLCGPVCRPNDTTTSTTNNNNTLTISSSDHQQHQLPIVTKKKHGDAYKEFSGYDVMEREGLDSTLRFIRNTYDKDVYAPRGARSAQNSPPISRVHAIYGINIPTEIGCVYHRQDTCQSQNHLQSLYVPDKRAIIANDRGKNTTGYDISNGIILETSKTKQHHDTYREVCGDGTVPYWSLAHSKTWNNPHSGRTVTVEELDKAPHREILADPRFHEAVWNYVVKHSQYKSTSRGTNSG